MTRQRQLLERAASGMTVVQGVLRDDILPPTDPTLLPTVGRLRVFSRSDSDGASALITAVTSNSIEMEGDHAAELLASQLVAVLGSTGNDGSWAITSASYDSGTDTTTVITSRTLPSAVADGRVRLPEIIDAGFDEWVTNRDVSLRLTAGTWLTCIAVAGELIPVVPGCVRVIDPDSIGD